VRVAHERQHTPNEGRRPARCARAGRRMESFGAGRARRLTPIPCGRRSASAAARPGAPRRRAS
jgi:hypothetical protein